DLRDHLRLPLPLPARSPGRLATGLPGRRDHRRAVRPRALGHRPVPGAGRAGQRLWLGGRAGAAARLDLLRRRGVLHRRAADRGDRRARQQPARGPSSAPGAGRHAVAARPAGGPATAPPGRRPAVHAAPCIRRGQAAPAYTSRMARIPDAFIDDLLARTDIVEVVNARVPLKRQGKEYSARCPFHDERSPSFTVSPTKQFYHCFGCGAHGTAISFLMQYDRLEFLDAVDELARQAGMEVPRETQQRNANPDTQDLFNALEAASRFFQRHLAGSDRARAYLDARGVGEAVRAQFAIGYAPDGFSALKDALGTDPRRLQLLERGGMLSKNDRGHVYDKFRDRVMFPILDRRGRVIAFGGRVLDAPTDGRDAGPKYLNSPETPLFHKGRELYGLWQVRQANPKIERLIVVEGYMDVIALFEHGVSQAVATLGTATTPDHAELLFRNAPDVYFCFDGDRAGRSAAWKAVESVLPRMREGRQAFFLFLPEGED